LSLLTPWTQEKFEEAAPLYKRGIAIIEKALGPEHPDLATSLNNLAGLLQAQGKLREAAAHCERAISIGEKKLGPQHPDLATWLYNFSGLLIAMGRLRDALPLRQRAAIIFLRTFGPEHPLARHKAYSVKELKDAIREAESRPSSSTQPAVDADETGGHPEGKE